MHVSNRKHFVIDLGEILQQNFFFNKRVIESLPAVGGLHKLLLSLHQLITIQLLQYTTLLVFESP